MSVATEYFHSRKRTDYAGALGIGRFNAWISVGLGAVALGLYLVLAATTESLWPVVVGPFFLVGVARLMGLRSLWSKSSYQSIPRE